MSYWIEVGVTDTHECAKQHTRIVWRGGADCPVCSLLADLGAVSAKLEIAERKLAVDTPLCECDILHTCKQCRDKN